MNVGWISWDLRFFCFHHATRILAALRYPTIVLHILVPSLVELIVDGGISVSYLILTLLCILHDNRSLRRALPLPYSCQIDREQRECDDNFKTKGRTTESIYSLRIRPAFEI